MRRRRLTCSPSPAATPITLLCSSSTATSITTRCPTSSPPPKPVAAAFNWNDYGYEIDGPVPIPKLFDGRNRLFFMSNFEVLAQRQNAQSVYSVPTAAMFAGNFSAYPTTIYQPGTNGIPFPGNIIPANQLDPISQKIVELLPFFAELPGLTKQLHPEQ